MARLIQGLHKTALTRDDIVNFGLQAFSLVSPEQRTLEAVTRAFIEAHDGLTFWQSAHPQTGGTTASHAALVLATVYGHSLPYEPDGEEWLNQLFVRCSRTSERLGGETTPTGHLLYSRATGLLQMANEYRKLGLSIVTITQNMPGLEKWDLSDRSIEQYRRQAEELAGYLGRYTAYSIKPCFVQDNLLMRPGDACVMMDGPEEVSKLPAALHGGLAVPLALLSITERNKIKQVGHDYNNSFGDGGKTGILQAGHPLNMSIHVSDKGELFADGAYEMVPLEHVFNAAGRPELYPLFWLIQLMRLCDVALPITKRVEHRIPSLPALPGRRKDRERYAEQLPGLFAELWLPRIRAMADAGTAAAIETEIEEDRIATERATRNAPERVEGHWRRLLEHQKASPEAIDNAIRERKKPPPEGYTYVKRRGASMGREVRRRRS